MDSSSSSSISISETPKHKGLLHCHYCGKCGNVQVCLGCHEVYYCNRECQKAEWLMHRIWCKTRQKQLAYKEEQRSMAQSRTDSPSSSSSAVTSTGSLPSYLSGSQESASSSDPSSAGRVKRSSKKTGPTKSSIAAEAAHLTPQQLSEKFLSKPGPDDLNAVFGVSIEEGLRRSAHISPDLPDVLSFCLAYIELYGLDEVGVFRLSGSLRDVAVLRYMFQQGLYPAPTDIRDVNVATNLLKLYFRELPEPLFEPRSDYVPGSHGKISPYREVIESISIERRRIAYALFRLLHMIVNNSDVNKMSGGNIAIVLSPTLKAASDTVDQLTLHFDTLFTDEDAPAFPPDWPTITADSRCVYLDDTAADEGDS